MGILAAVTSYTARRRKRNDSIILKFILCGQLLIISNKQL